MALRNPNGYGSVVKLSGKRRKPYMVRKTVSWDDNAYPVYQIIGYYEKRADAVNALADFNTNPYDVDLAKIAFSELYELWSKEEFPKFKPSLVGQHKAAYKHCASLHALQYSAIRKYQMQRCIDGCGRGYSTRATIKNLLTHMDAFAYDQDIIRKCYSANLSIGDAEEMKSASVYSSKEIELLWKHQGEPYIDETLFQLYTGMRVSEMLLMKCENVDLEAGIMTGGMKTRAGKNRIIPIHDKLRPIVERHLSARTYLFDYMNGKRDDQLNNVKTVYTKKFGETMTALGMKHRTHDCRHTFRSKLDSAGANKVCIDLIMGHSTGGTGEKIYTHKTVEELKTALSLLAY